MSSLSDRLREVIRQVGGPQGPPLRGDSEGPPLRGDLEGPALRDVGEGPALDGEHDDSRGGPSGPSEIADLLGGQWCGSHGQRFLVIDRKYSPGHRHGSLAVADVLPPADGIWPGMSLLSELACGVGPSSPDETQGDPEPIPSRLFFLDLETTGLAGGAGTYAFLVGCGWFDGTSFRVRQFFLANFAAERAFLDAFGDLLASKQIVVTYNGKSFDVPLVDTRFLLHRMATQLAGFAHLDMLHYARRLWRAEEHALATSRGCRLSMMERTVCGHVREDDVPGSEIPSRYFHYVRTNDPRPLFAVLEHNRLDLLSLAMLTARAARLLAEGPSATHTPREALGLGQLYERAGMNAAARRCYAHAVGVPDAGASGLTRGEALHAYAVLCRRDRQYEEAAVAWQSLIETPCAPQFVREASEALAVHHEHRIRDLEAARRFALQTLYLPSTVLRRQAVEHRLARLNRKLSASQAQDLGLF